jgi:parallel beta-helix repeat protein
LTDGAVWASGKIGNALYFDGIDDVITVPNSNPLNLSNSFTLSAWVNPASAFNDFRSIVAKNDSYYLYASSAGFCGDGAPFGYGENRPLATVCQPFPLPANTWTHLALTYSGSTLTLYRNGVAVNTATASGTLPISSGTLQIGGSQFGEYFNGMIDELRIYNTVLTPTEIQTKYQEESGIAAGTSPVTGTLFSFSVSNSGNKSVVAGSSVTNSVSAALVSGISQAVSFSLSGLPAGATGTFSSPSCSPACSTILNISTTGSTPAGSFPITVTAAGGGVTKSTAFTLSVTLALTVATPTITPNGGNFSGSVSVAMQSATSGASIYYTTDGSTPTQSSSPYTGMMVLTDSTTMKAKAFKSGSNPSSVISASFVKNSTGNTYYVATNGSDSNPGSISQPFRSIRKGVSVLGAGDTVYIRSGIYQENLDGNRDKIPSGTSWSNPVTIAAYPGETVTMVSPNSAGIINFSTSSLNPTLEYVIVDGIVFDGTNVSGGVSGIAVGFSDGSHPPAHHIRFINFEIKNVNSANGSVSGVGSGVQVYGSFNEFINCSSHDNGKIADPNGNSGHGFYLGGTNHLVERCKIHNNGGYGAHVYSTSGGVNNVTLRYNEIYNNGLTSPGTFAGIILNSGTGNRAYSNIVRGNLGGIQIGGGCAGCLVYNNTVYSSRYWGIQIDPGATNNAIKNNIAYQNADGNVVDYGRGNSLSNNFTSDPKFANASANDFHLQSGSPAIDTGIALTEVSYDFTGILRPQGAGYDIGAFER